MLDLDYFLAVQGWLAGEGEGLYGDSGTPGD